MNTSIPERIARLRTQMQAHQLHAYIIPSSDPHQSEYVAPHWKTRQWISGFSGSAGVLIVSADHAGLWTDSRYFLQAVAELAGTGIELHRQEVPHAPEHIPWLAGHLPKGARVGLDGYLFSQSQIRYLEKHFKAKGIQLRTDIDLMPSIWADRPPLPQTPVFEHSPVYAGRTRAQKLASIREKMQARGADAHFIPTLDDIAWSLNIRSADVDFNPVAYAYLLITVGEAYLFMHEAKLPDELRRSLADDGVVVSAYDKVLTFLAQLPAKTRILIDPENTNIRLLEVLTPGQCIRGELIPRSLKAIKNKVEIEYIRQVMVKDGVALTDLFRWLEDQLQQGETPTEVEVATHLATCRARQKNYIGESFAAIVGYQGNGAIIHYHPQAETCATIRPEGILLLDSGGQYLDGTTDVTRTVALGEPSEAQKLHFTLVLQGHIALDRIQFPKGTSGGQLDAFARAHLWRHGLNYGHGTGHGVGFFLSVHEPPQGFAASVVTSRGSAVFEAGMLTSNEPGFYQNGSHGIRIENLILCVEKEKTEYGEFLAFETLTLFPIDSRLIKKDCLSPEEIDWLNTYHRRVEAALSPHLDAAGREWMADKCREI